MDLHFYSAFPVYWMLKELLQHMSHSPTVLYVTVVWSAQLTASFISAGGICAKGEGWDCVDGPGTRQSQNALANAPTTSNHKVFLNLIK